MKELYFLLKPSPIAGVGIFTERNIRKDEYLQLQLSPLRDYKIYKNPKGRLKQMCDHFGIEHTKNCYTAPINFVQMSLVWYLNHSDTPNVRVTATRAYALCNIKKGEELTVDYRTLDDNVDNTNGIYIEKKTC